MKNIIVLLFIFISLNFVIAQSKDIKTAIDEANKLSKSIDDLKVVIEKKKADYTKKKVKDEFESIAEFNERMEKEVRNSYKKEFDTLDNYNIDLTVLLENKYIFSKETYKVELLKYDAENRKYEISFECYLIKNPNKKDEWLSRKLTLDIDGKTAKDIKTNWGKYPVEVYGELSNDGQNYIVGKMSLSFFDSNKTNLVSIEIGNVSIGGMVFVEGGAFKSTKSNYDKNTTVTSFYISKYEVTQAEWVEVMGSNPSNFKGDNLPVESVSWYDCVEYCNKRSIKEGFTPVYTIDKNKKDSNNTNEYDDIKWTVTANWSATGYRLPTEAEWEYAATGGQKSISYIYSGSDNIDEVAEYSGNNYESTKSVGGKKPNELGLYDMSGNVWEGAQDWYSDSVGTGQNPKGVGSGSYRVFRGGSWFNYSEYCESSYRDYYYPGSRNNKLGFRLVVGVR